jgi:anti-sigma-K factor RskA
MEHGDARELTAAYALDALDVADARAFEAHLATCDDCRAELAVLRDAAGALAYAPAGPAPARGLRDRIVAQARAEPSSVVPLRSRRAVPVLTGVAAAAAAVVVGLGFWGLALQQALDREREVTRVLADPAARSIALAGASGRLVVTPEGDAVLVVAGLARAPEGKDYELWVIGRGAPAPAGVFDGPGSVRLDEEVPRGATVAVTLEREGGVDAPTTEPLLTART